MRQHIHVLTSRPVTLMLCGALVLLPILAVLEIVIAKSINATFSIFFPLLILVLFLLFWPRWGVKWQMSLTFRQRPDANVLIEWEISEETVKVHVDRLSSSESRGQLLKKRVETPDGFLFYFQPQMFQWLPFSAFEQPEAVAKVREFAQANGVKYIVRK